MRLQERRLPGLLGAAIVVGAVAWLFWKERRKPLRHATGNGLQRNVQNMAIGLCAAMTVQFVELPITKRMTEAVERKRWGLLKQIRLPVWLEVVAALTLLDYTLYMWHVLAHRVPFLWRFHAVHHVDIDLDVSTGLRFHAGELLLSIPWRAAQIRIIGVSPLSLSIWQTMMLVAIAFHHSNIALPPAFERKLGRILVTPRMHGIHHSMVREETNSNWSSGLSIWDRTHRTMRLNIPQTELTIGLPFQRESLGLLTALKLPAMVRGTEWVLPSGLIPGRTDSTGPRTFLAE